MKLNSRAFALGAITSILIAGCGGGGGGGGGTSGGSTPQSVAVTESNAKPVAASGLDAVQNASATSGATGPVAVQVDGGTGGASTLQAVAEAVRFAAASAKPANLPVGVAVNQTVQCDGGGTMTINGNVSGGAGLAAGDSVSISMTNCGVMMGSSMSMMNGTMTVTVASGSVTGMPFHVVLAITMSNVSVAGGGVTAVASGDTRMDWTANSATSQILTSSGSAMASRETGSGATHTITLRNYTQSLAISGTAMTGSLSATVETDSSRLGAGSASFAVTTPVPVVWTASSRNPTAGAIKVVGANGSQLLATFHADGTVAIQVDANGDGAYEKTITTTGAELAGLV